MRGKLVATRGRLVTRDNEGQEEEEEKKRRRRRKASARSLERDSGRVAPLPIRGTTIPRIGRIEDRPRIVHRRRRFEGDRRIVGQWTSEKKDGRRVEIDRGSPIPRLFGIATLVAVAAALFVPIASPVPLSGTGPRAREDDLHRFTGLEDVYEDVFREEDRASRSGDETELDIIRRSIARGLGLERIPDPSKVSSLVSLPSPPFLPLAVKTYLRTITIDTGRKIRYPRSWSGITKYAKRKERLRVGIEYCTLYAREVRREKEKRKMGEMKRTKEKDGREMAGIAAMVQRGGWSAVAPLSLRMHEHVRIPASMQNRLRCPRACANSASSFSPTAIGRCTVKKLRRVSISTLRSIVTTRIPPRLGR